MIIFQYQQALARLCYFLADCCFFIYTLLKAYRIICYTKIVFDQLPYFSPYRWPLSIIRKLTDPYFKFWSKLLPLLRIGRSPFDISSIISLEILSTLLNGIFHLKVFLLLEAEIFEKTIPTKIQC